MNTLIDYQIISDKNGRPEYAVIPYKVFLSLTPEAVQTTDETIPHDVVGRVIKQHMNIIQAWREHLKLTQKAVAQRMGITQAAYSQMEKKHSKPRHATLQKIAHAMGLSIEQLH